ncbi:MAG: YfbM family protein [Myxococcales bacterium]|nr:YfbM family protein [Myxococcales bacterium]
MSMIGNFRRVPDARLLALLEDPESVVDFLDEQGFSDLDVDKAWHGLHYLFTGTAWEGSAPLNFLVAGGRPVGDVDVGYGPARAFLNAEVRELVGALAPLTPEVLAERFNPAAMTHLEIYPDVWSRDAERDENLKYLLGYFVDLKEFIEGGAKSGEGLLVFLT